MREAAAAILFDSLGHLLLQLRDNIPNIRYPGKIGLFGGHREGDESFLDCVVREVHEELSFYLPPERFRFIARPLILTCEVARFTPSFSLRARYRSKN